MKFKMAPNSLFAVLLRSPWWVSMAIALVFGSAAFALLPEPYRVMGAMGGFPFVGIGLVALWQQMRLPSEKRCAAVLGAVSRMNWPEFSRLLQHGFAQQGYEVKKAHGPVDFELTRAGATTLVAARRWKAARHGEEALQALHGAAQSRDASHCLYIALGDLSANAHRFARSNQVQLMNGPALALLLKDARLPA